MLGDKFEEAQRVVMLRSVDRRWMDHIDDMDELKRGIGLMAYGQRDPVVEFKFQSYDIFDQMVNNNINEEEKEFVALSLFIIAIC